VAVLLRPGKTPSGREIERFPVWLNRDSQGRQKGGVSSIDSAL
jgi:hypothetical protein